MDYFAIYNKYDLKTVLHFTARTRDEALEYFANYISEDFEMRQDLDYAFDATKTADELIKTVYRTAGTAD